MSDAVIGQQARVRRHANLLVQGGSVLTPNGAERIKVACADGRIVALGDLQGIWSADTTLDVTSSHVLLGVIDSQVHFREPGLTHKEDLEIGTRRGAPSVTTGPPAATAGPPMRGWPSPVGPSTPSFAAR